VTVWKLASETMRFAAWKRLLNRRQCRSSSKPAAVRRQAAGRIDALVAQSGQQRDLLGQAARLGQEVDVADVAGVGIAEEELRERYALQHRELEAGGGVGFGHATDLGDGAQRFEGVAAGAGLQLVAHELRESGGTDLIERLEDQRADAVMRVDREKSLPVERRIGVGQFVDLRDLLRTQPRAGRQQHQPDVAWEIAERKR
jgi:hypothetical protein